MLTSRLIAEVISMLNFADELTGDINVPAVLLFGFGIFFVKQVQGVF